MVCRGVQIDRSRYATCLRFALLAAGAVLTALTLVFPNIGILEWITLVPAGVVILNMTDSGIKLRRAYLWGLYFFMCYGLMLFHWFFELYPMEFTGMSRGAAMVVVIAGWTGLSFLQAIAAALIFPAMVLFGRSPIVRRFPIFKPFLMAGMWVMMEWGQTLFWFGVPWGKLAMGQVCVTVMARAAALFGSYFVTFMIVSVGMLIALAIVEPPRVKFASVLAGGLVALELVLGVGVTLAGRTDADSKETIRVAVLQGNISSSEKWNVGVDEIIAGYAVLCRDAAGQGAELIIWPETAVPISVDRNPARRERLCDIAYENNVDMLVGMFTHDENGGERNSLVLFRRDGTVSDEIYSKRHLVPFGEYLPLRRFIMTVIPPLSQVAMLENDLVPGEDSGLIQVGDMRVGSLICFDSIYEELTLRSVLDGAELIVLSTNDSWFGDSAALRMHCAHDQLRAIESGRTILRAANTGISSMICPDGTMPQHLDDNAEGLLVCDAEIRTGRTLYTIIGNLFVYLAIAFIFGMGAASVITSKH